MPCCQLDEFVMFVDAKNLKTNERHPKEIPFPHILDQRDQQSDPNKHATYLKLNDAAAYITHFIAIGVDTELIPEILKSEYRTTQGEKVETIDFAAQVQDVLNMIMPYLKKDKKGNPIRDYPRKYEAPQSHGQGKHQDQKGKPLKGYELDFRVNWYVTGGGKVPMG
jgi:hypothetical protein